MGHEYTPQQALDMLLTQLEIKSPDLVAQIKKAIDAGKEIPADAMDEFPHKSTKKTAKQVPLKNVPLSDEEAISVALTILQSHLLENRVIMQKVYSELVNEGVASPNDDIPISKHQKKNKSLYDNECALIHDEGGKKSIKHVEIEVGTETTRTKKDQKNFSLNLIDEDELNSLKEVFLKLETLMDFR